MTRYHWHPLARPVRRLLASPPALLRRVGGPAISIDGRELHPATQALLATMNRLRSDRGAQPSIERRRSEIRLGAAIGLPQRRDVHVSTRWIETFAPVEMMEIRVFRPASTEPLPGLVYAHGGGWVVGDLDTHDAVCRIIAAEAKVAVFSAHYRRAPEYHHPVALDDIQAAYEWVRRHAAELDLDSSEVGVMGDSAGAHLALCLSQRSVDGATPTPRMQALIYPAADLTMTRPSTYSLGDGFGLTRNDMTWYREQYLGTAYAPDDPTVSPMFATTHVGLPPTYVATAGFDPLRDDGEDYAALLRSHGVHVEYQCFDDQVHGFFGMGILPGGLERIESIARRVGRMIRADYTGGTP